MQNEIIINAVAGETRVAVLERSVFTELHIERHRERSVAGSVIKGRVSRVLPGMQAAFVNIGLEKAAFLYAGDYFDNTAQPDANGEDSPPSGGRRNRGRNGGRREPPPKIDSMLREGQEIIVQVAKEPIGTKGARIISHISIPGRHLVLTPWSNRVGVSRRIDNDRERRRLREIVARLRPPELGFIIRTAGGGVREPDLEADIRYLTSVWDDIQMGMGGAAAPAVLYREPALPLRVIRDFTNPETKRVVIDSEQVYETLTSFVKKYVADPQPKIEHYTGAKPIFDQFSLESQIHGSLQRKVWLKSGGSLIVDQSEALTAIDVNTGRFVGRRDLEDTVLKTNLEAVKEIVHQLRFRNIGGLIIIDLIDMESQENRDKVYRALQEAIRGDKTKTNILRISELGLVEMTRKRTRENLVQTLCEPCSYCEGRGYVLSRESVAFKVLREIRMDLPRFCGRRIAVTVSPHVAEQLLTFEKEAVRSLGEDLGREIEIRARPGIHQEQFEVSALDEGPPVAIPLRWLKPPEEEIEAPAEEKPEAEAEPDGEAQREPAVPPEAETQPEVEAEGPVPQVAETAGGERLETLPQPEALSAASLGDGGSAESEGSPEPGEAAAALASPKGHEEPAVGMAPDPSAPAQALDETAESRILPPSEKSEGS
jgi:ribonuclease G